jgi:hypothetical protein
MSDRAREIFKNACIYSKTALLINSFTNVDNSLLIPSQVVAALALELYFKALYFLDSRIDFKDDGNYSHDFYKLYVRLSEPIKTKLRYEFKIKISSDRKKEIRKLEKQWKLTLPLDLEGNLKEWSKVFVSMRYIYDNIGKVKSTMFFPEIEATVLGAIYEKDADLKQVKASIPAYQPLLSSFIIRPNEIN